LNETVALPVLPALSRQLPETAAPWLSGPLYVAEEQLAMPDRASLPEKAIVSAWLYQPFASGGRLGAPLTAGGVASYLSEIAPLVVFPALSRQLPETAAAGLSGPLYAGDEQLATPDISSDPKNLTATG
jgi:hypothetical protein